MKLKLDENLGERGRALLQAAGQITGRLWIVERGRIRLFDEERAG